jgi:RpiB/LacA/LacB family sugar-phosphate isomerase
MREVITAEDVRLVAPGGEIVVAPGALVTPWAIEIAQSRGVRIVHGTIAAKAAAIAIGADHGGYALKEELKGWLARCGYRFHDLGTHSKDPVDYPDIAYAVANAVRQGDARFGILVDGAGIGSAMAANKVPGVRAALCRDAAAARNAREHNDANVVTLGAGWADVAAAQQILEVFLNAQCTEERHLRRVRKIDALDENYKGQ